MKPANVLGAKRRRAARILNSIRDDPSVRTKVTDFGLAKRMDDKDGVTQTGQILDASYPGLTTLEAGRGEVNVGVPADVYAMGAVATNCSPGGRRSGGIPRWDTLLQVVPRLRAASHALMADRACRANLVT